MRLRQIRVAHCFRPAFSKIVADDAAVENDLLKSHDSIFGFRTYGNGSCSNCKSEIQNLKSKFGMGM